jgi:rod shape-determining protein MreD
VWAGFTAVALILEMSLRGEMMLASVGGISPSFMAALVVFIALSAPRLAAVGAAWLMGLLMDLAPEPPAFAPGLHLIGPYALGYPVAAFVVVQLRPLVLRRRSLTVAVLTVLALVAVGLVTVTLYTVRGWYDLAGPGPTGVADGFRPLPELARRLGIALYSGLIAFPLGWLLLATAGWWGFRDRDPRH